jgi:hypothetical protein
VGRLASTVKVTVSPTKGICSLTPIPAQVLTGLGVCGHEDRGLVAAAGEACRVTGAVAGVA